MIEDKIRIGTSGYTYSWNKAKPNAFEWYINQGFNSVEINIAFTVVLHLHGSILGESKLRKHSRFQSKYIVQLHTILD